MMQRSAILPKFGAKSLVIRDDPDFRMTPSTADTCIIRVEAACVQSTDLMIRSGSYPALGVKPPFATGYEFVGTVVAAGAASGWREGDRVCDMVRVGAHTRFIERPGATLCPVPASVDAFQADTVIVAWLTAYQLLHRSDAADIVARKLPVFVQGGSGLVGSAIVKQAVEAGCPVFTSVRGARFAEMEALGATPLDFTQPNWWRGAREKIGGGGAAVVFDGICADNYKSSYGLLRPGGLVQAYGMHSMVLKHTIGSYAALASVGFAIARIAVCSSRSWKFYAIDTLRDKHPDWFKQDLAALFDRLAKGELALSEVEKVSFEELDAAHARLAKGAVRTALVLDPSK